MAKVTVYTKDYCPFCDRAKALLDNKGQAYEEIHLSTASNEFAELAARTGMRTVPQIFIDDQLVGGFTELAALESSGELDKRLT